MLPPQIRSVARTVVLVLRDTRELIQSAQLLMVASSLAYTTILSIIPLLAVSFSIFQAFGGLDKLYATIEPVVINNLAEGSSEEVMVQIRHFIGNIHAGALGAGGMVGLIFTCMSMLFSAEKAINRVWNAPMNRTLFQRVSSYWLLITLGPLAMAFMLGAGISAQIPLTRYLPSGTGGFLLAIGLFFVTYKFVPHRRVHWMPALIAAWVTAVAWNVARLGYAVYTSKVLTYSKIYGSLGAVPILLLWIYIIWVVILSGAALGAALQKRAELT
jgi:membrane protein